jgi:hypothetical protein
MSSDRPNLTSFLEDAVNHGIEPRQQPDLSGPRFQRVAELVANGDLPLPLDLSDEQLAKLVREVQERRRRRLVHFVARAIAMDIVNGCGQGGEAENA